MLARGYECRLVCVVLLSQQLWVSPLLPYTAPSSTCSMKLYDSGWTLKRYSGSRQSRLVRRTVVGVKGKKMTQLDGCWQTNFLFLVVHKERNVGVPVRQAKVTRSRHLQGSAVTHGQTQRHDLVVDIPGFRKNQRYHHVVNFCINGDGGDYSTWRRSMRAQGLDNDHGAAGYRTLVGTEIFYTIDWRSVGPVLKGPNRAQGRSIQHHYSELARSQAKALAKARSKAKAQARAK